MIENLFLTLLWQVQVEYKVQLPFMVRRMSVDQAIPSGWCWRRWLACLDWQADSIPDPRCKSRKLLYPMQQLMGLSKGGFFFICSISLYQVQSKPAVILFLLGAFKGKFFKFKGLSFKSKGLSSKYHKWMKTKHLQDRSWTNRGNFKDKKVDMVFPMTESRNPPFRY